MSCPSSSERCIWVWRVIPGSVGAHIASCTPSFAASTASAHVSAPMQKCHATIPPNFFYKVSSAGVSFAGATDAQTSGMKNRYKGVAYIYNYIYIYIFI